MLEKLKLPNNMQNTLDGITSAIRGLALEREIDANKEDQLLIDTFLDDWLYNQNNIRKVLANNSETRSNLKEQLDKMGGKLAYHLSLMLLPFLFTRTTTGRDMVTTIFHDLPMEKLHKEQIQIVFTVLSAELFKFLTTSSGPTETGEILDTLVEALAEIARVKNAASEEWKNLLGMLELTSKTADELARESVEKFKTRQNQPSLPNENSTVVVFKGA